MRSFILVSLIITCWQLQSWSCWGATITYELPDEVLTKGVSKLCRIANCPGVDMTARVDYLSNWATRVLSVLGQGWEISSLQAMGGSVRVTMEDE